MELLLLSVHFLLYLMLVLFLDSFLCHRFHKQSLEISWPRLGRKRSEEYFSYTIGCKKKALSNIPALSSSWKITKLSQNLTSFTLIYLQGFHSWLRIFRDNSLSILNIVFVNKSCCLLKFFIELYFLSWLFIKISFLSLCWLFSVAHEHDMQYFISKIKMKMILRPLTTRCVRVFK